MEPGVRREGAEASRIDWLGERAHVPEDLGADNRGDPVE